MAQLIRHAASRPHTYWYVSPSYSAAKRTVWDDPEMMPRLLPGWNDENPGYFKKNESEMRITFPKSGGNIYLIGSDRPDLMRGPNPWGVVHDEFSVQRPEVWKDVVQPILLANPQSWAWFTFTPRGRNHAYDLMMQNQNNPDWQLSTLNAYNSGIFTKEQADGIKLQMSEQSFKQEFMCEFLEGEGSVFRHVRQIATALPEEPKPGHLYVMGVDLGKSQDYTVVAVYDRSTNSQVYQSRFNTIEWPYQKAKIQAISRHYNNALTVIDASGLGSPVFDDLSRSGVPVQPVKFTNTTKKELIEKLSINIEQRYIRILDLPETMLEFDSYEFEYTKSGLVTYNARAGMHDDIVISHALAVSELQPLPKGALMGVEPTRIQQYMKDLQSPKDPDAGLIEWGNNDSFF